jgi:hypothetical protein
VSVKSAVFAAATLGVVVLGVYLFIQVRATPAQARGKQVATRETPSAPAPDVTAEPTRPSESAVRQLERAPRIGAEVEGSPPLASADGDTLDVKLDSLMEQANKAYDTQDFDNAIAIAGKVLVKDKGNVRMLRIMVSASCILGDSVVAQRHYEQLPKFDRDQMRTRCDRYGVSFKEPAE